jgi:amino acid adenylation domain-containing protein
MAFLLQHLLTESAQKFPDKEAIRFQGQGLSYAQLDRVTNQVARTLQTVGVQRSDRVGIYLHKSLASIISVFGILKAGGVYVPLDPNAPPTRLAYITRNCDVRVLLTSAENAALSQLISEATPLETLVLTDEQQLVGEGLAALELITWQQVIGSDDSPILNTGAIETDLAYILYTSGSTGNPKGVMIAHRTIFTFINWCNDTFAISEKDRVTSHAPLHFDLSTFDIYVTFKAGGTVVLVPERLSVFPIQLVRLLQDEKITVTYMVPSIFSLMLNYGKLAAYDLSQLHTVLFAGEVFPIKYLRELVAALPAAEFYNLYGPTETNVCTYYKVQAKDLESDCTQPVPIGIACENIEVCAVNEAGQFVTEIGQEGELWVRGSCVAQGYWADPEKTARGFVRNSFQPNYEEIAYRTGDIVTLDKDGVNWRFVGRRDHMIKSRGYRIELGEIESALYGHSGVKEAAVVAVPDDLLGNRLKAFVVLLEESTVTAKDMQSHCSSHLPRYMVPEIFEFRKELPKTSTGKINRIMLVD